MFYFEDHNPHMGMSEDDCLKYDSTMSNPLSSKFVSLRIVIRKGSRQAS